MHGRNRAEYNAKVSSPDFTRALTKKVSNYAALVNACSSRKKKKVYDMETLGLIGTVLTINPDYATFWNYRREIVTAGGAGDWVSESEITNKCLTKNPKSYPSWFHRKWSFLHFPTSPISSEITLTTTFLKLDSRNFHCWNYRRFLISQQIGVDSATGEIKDLLIKSGFGCQLSNQRNKINKNVEFNQESCLSILLSEFEYTLELIKTNFSNYSAYHYRSHLLPLIHLLQTLDSESESEGYFRKLAVVKKELELVQQAIFTEPSDQSSWWYQQFLFKYIVPPKNDKMSEEKKRYAETLQEETEPLRELIAEEMKEGVSGGAKWALNSLWGILETLDEMVGMGLGEDADQVLEVLLMGDEGGMERYGGLKREKEARNTKVLFVYQAREGGDVYLEIKRGSGEPKHKFVSWFKISNGKATRLTFKSWDKENGVRIFETGALQVDAEGAGWIDAQGLTELVKRKKTDVERDVVNACLNVWG